MPSGDTYYTTTTYATSSAGTDAGFYWFDLPTHTHDYPTEQDWNSTVVYYKYEIEPGKSNPNSNIVL